MKKLVICFCVVILCCYIMAACSGNDDRLQITASDIAEAELIVQPSDENERYKLIDESDYEKIAKLISMLPNDFVSDPESITGGASTLYITLTDGTVHTICNNGNVYIDFDGKSYGMSEKLLSLWEEYGFNIGNAKVPDDFSY